MNTRRVVELEQQRSQGGRCAPHAESQDAVLRAACQRGECIAAAPCHHQLLSACRRRGWRAWWLTAATTVYDARVAMALQGAPDFEALLHWGLLIPLTAWKDIVWEIHDSPQPTRVPVRALSPHWGAWFCLQPSWRCSGLDQRGFNLRAPCPSIKTKLLSLTTLSARLQQR